MAVWVRCSDALIDIEGHMVQKGPGGKTVWVDAIGSDPDGDNDDTGFCIARELTDAAAGCLLTQLGDYACQGPRSEPFDVDLWRAYYDEGHPNG